MLPTLKRTDPKEKGIANNGLCSWAQPGQSPSIGKGMEGPGHASEAGARQPASVGASLKGPGWHDCNKFFGGFVPSPGSERGFAEAGPIPTLKNLPRSLLGHIPDVLGESYRSRSGRWEK